MSERKSVPGIQAGDGSLLHWARDLVRHDRDMIVFLVSEAVQHGDADALKLIQCEGGC